MKTKTTIDKTKTTINKIRYKGIEILLPTPITVDMDELKSLQAIDEYALILRLFGESLSKWCGEKKYGKGKGKPKK